ncbi:MAG: ketoacyl-ACP synthase III [Synergistaceae bacterium]|jgi:3-oxoacyl-[acyl-carrier-protein] synthase-3|nr:ketoacyl-ACP synthase III [Synergistaceae bacterium]
MTKTPGIEDIAYYLPERVVTNEQFGEEYPGWNYKRVAPVVGIYARHVEEDSVPVSDMAARAAEKLFSGGRVSRGSIDFVVQITEIGDYLMPSTACIVQEKLGLPNSAGAFDMNLACSGYVYGLAVAKSLVCGGVASRVLLITAEKNLFRIHKNDPGTRFLHGDAATATVVSRENVIAEIGEFDVGTDGGGSKYLLIPAGGTATPYSEKTSEPWTDEIGQKHYPEYLYMNGMAVYNFTAKRGPESIRKAIAKNGLEVGDIAYFISHQASKAIIKNIRAKMGVDEDKVPSNLDKVGNTGSSSIPILLTDIMPGLPAGAKLLLSGFGIGLSWGSVVLTAQ